MMHMLGDLPFDGRLIKHGDQDYELLKYRLRLCESSQKGDKGTHCIKVNLKRLVLMASDLLMVRNNASFVLSSAKPNLLL